MNARYLDPTIFIGHTGILACDPGMTAGWANITWLPTADNGDVPIFNAGEIPAWDYVDWFARVVTNRDLVVVEAYVITPRTAKLSQQTDALEMIGALRWICRNRGTSFDVSQKAPDARDFDPKGDKLKQLDMWATSSDHAQMAARHLLLKAVRSKLIDPRRLVLR